MRSPDPIAPERLEELLRGAPPDGEREARVQGLVRELRADALPAPEGVRERVRALREPVPPKRRFSRRAALILVPVAVAVAGALLLPLERTSRDEAREATSVDAQPEPAPSGPAQGALGSTRRSPVQLGAATDRVADVDVALEVRVRDQRRLEEADSEAGRITRALGGYVVTASFGTSGSEGRADLTVKVPATRVQAAIARYSELGTVTGQQIAIRDRQAELDARTARTQRPHRALRITELKLRSTTLTPEQRLDLQVQRQRQQGLLDELLRANRRLLRETRMADVDLALHTGPPPAKEEGDGRLTDAVGGALDVLAVAGAAAVFLAIVFAPFLALGLVVWLALRASRRRRDERLLEAPRPHAPPS
jgi:Domain of unknown function (DUF4349)